MSKPVNKLLEEIKEAGLIYDPYITATIIGYEAGHMMRNCFYAQMVGNTKDEQDLRAGWLANARVELSDLITQARILAAVYGWDWSALVETGEEKLTERIDTYKQRGVRPNQALMESFNKNMNGNIESMRAPASTMPVRKHTYKRDGD